MKKIIYAKPDGFLWVFHPAENARLKGETDDEFLDRLRPRVVPADATNVRYVEASEIPADRCFRNAWKDSGRAVTVNMPEAREIHCDMLRAMREPLLEALDVETLRNLSDSVKLAEIEAQKQELRDVTEYPAIEAATTPEELKAAIPPCLSIS